jgi:hypothetical protein
MKGIEASFLLFRIWCVGLRFFLSEIAELVARRKRGISLLARMKKKFQQLYEPVHYLAPVECTA